MRRIHGHLYAPALAIVILHVSMLVLGSLRVCWSDAHTHADHPADCPMHHLPATPSPGHAHHGHDSGMSDTAREAPQIACRCTDDPLSPYAGPDVILGAPASLSLPAAALTPVAGDRSPAQVWLSTLSPPPRAPFSALS